MVLFEIVIALLLIGALLALGARCLGAPYPAFLAIAGAVLALIPGMPVLSLQPDLVLTLFVAPTLLDAAYDASARDLKDNWLPIGGSAVLAVVLTVLAVAFVAHLLRPDMPWAVALTLGAIVAPPDASAATAVLRSLRPPHRVMVILEGESLLNDATALLIYRAGISAALGAWAGWAAAPSLALSVAGGIPLGVMLGFFVPRIISRISDVATSVIMQFVFTFAVWMLANRLQLSAVITMVSFAITLAHVGPSRMGARHRIQSFAVWEVAVFVLNVLAFILAGLQLGPILSALRGIAWRDYALFGGAVLLTCIVIRIVWVMSYNTAVRWKNRRFGPRLRRRMTLPTVATGTLASWCGMRGVVTLATAVALPGDDTNGGFPFRELILFSAYSVVLGTLVIQGLTLRPLMRRLTLPEDRAVEDEISLARDRTARAALACLADESSRLEAVQIEYAARVIEADRKPSSEGDNLLPARRRALAAERRALAELRATGAIGDDAFHAVEEELDWTEMYIEERLGRSDRG